MKTRSVTEDAVLNGLRQGSLTPSQLLANGIAFLNAARQLSKRKASRETVVYTAGAFRLLHWAVR